MLEICQYIIFCLKIVNLFSIPPPYYHSCWGPYFLSTPLLYCPSIIQVSSIGEKRSPKEPQGNKASRHPLQMHIQKGCHMPGSLYFCVSYTLLYSILQPGRFLSSYQCEGKTPPSSGWGISLVHGLSSGVLPFLGQAPIICGLFRTCPLGPFPFSLVVSLDTRHGKSHF